MSIRATLLLLPVLLALAAAPARADVTARYVYDRAAWAAIVVQTNDAGQARISMGTQAALIVRDGNVYMLMADLQGPYAIRYDDLMNVLRAQAQESVRGIAGQTLPERIQYDAVEIGPASVAGYSGTAWTVVQQGRTPEPDSLEVVVSTDPVLAPVGRALARLTAASTTGLAPITGGASFSYDFMAAMTSIFERGAVLRLGRVMHLESAAAGPVPAAQFALPGEPLTPEQFAARTGMPLEALSPGAARAVAPPGPPPPPVRAPGGGTRARANLASYVSDADYPPEAIMQEQDGVVGFRLDVGPDGLVTRCVVTASSGSAALDEATCRIMTERPRFTPARDRRGRAIADRVSSRMRWVLPMDAPVLSGAGAPPGN